MTEREIRQLLEYIDEVGRKASQSKEYALQILEESGVMDIIRRSNEEDEGDKEEDQN